MSQKFILFIAAFVVWCLFNWVPDGAHLLAGIPVAAVVAVLMGDLVVQRPHLLRHLRRYGYFLFQYVPVLLWEVLKANIDVAYRAVHPDLPIKPGIVKVRTSLESDIARTMLANSITLTPGTMSVDIDSARSVLYIHWVDVQTQDVEEASRAIVERFERLLRRVFEEESGE